MVHANVISGNVHNGAWPRTHRRASSAAPTVARITAGTPTYQNTQCRLCSAKVRIGSTGRWLSRSYEAIVCSVPGIRLLTVCTSGRTAKATTTRTASAEAASGSHLPLTSGSPRFHSSGSAASVTTRTKATASARGTSDDLLCSGYGRESTNPSTMPYAAPAARPAISGRAWRRRPSSSRLQYGISGRMSLAPSTRTSTVRPRARPAIAARTRSPAAPSRPRESMTRQKPPRKRIWASGSL